MIFYCPNCEKKYQIADKVIGEEGKTVRCVSCAHEWFQEPERIELDFVERKEDTVDEEPEEEFGDSDEAQDKEVAGVFDPDSNDLDEDYSSESDKTAEKIRALIEGSNTADIEESEEQQKEFIDEQDDIPPIPKAVTPKNENKDNNKERKKDKPTKEKKEKVAKTRNKAEVSVLTKVNSIAGAMLIFLAVLVVSVFFRGDIVKAWPASAMIFDKAGLSVPMKGEGLVIESFTAKALETEDGKASLVLRGRVVNLTQEAIIVPDMVVYFDDERAASKDSAWIIEPPVKELTAGESYSFTSNYDSPEKNLKSIILTFRQEFI